MYEAAEHGPARGGGRPRPTLLEKEPDAGLGNGGLGRLAACFLDSMATLGYPGNGYGIRYEFGIFEQEIVDGWQVERPDEWLRFGNPWEFVRPEYAVPVRFGGRVEHRHGRGRAATSRAGSTARRCSASPSTRRSRASATTPSTRCASGRRAPARSSTCRSSTTATTCARSRRRTTREVISKVLYPNDHNQAGRELRLKQEYFFVACAISDIVRRYQKTHTNFDDFAKKNAIQLNDTHPAIAIAELMRVLVDEKRLPWDEAWEHHRRDVRLHEPHAPAPRRSSAGRSRCSSGSCRATCRSSTRSTAASCARCDRASRATTRACAACRSSRRAPEKKVAHGAPRGRRLARRQRRRGAPHAICCKRDVLRDFAEMYPERFNNKTNGVTPRRWLLAVQPAPLRAHHRGASAPSGSPTSTSSRSSSELADDAAFRAAFARGEAPNKADFAQYIRATALEVPLRPGRDLRRPDQAPARVQAAAAQRAPRRARSTSTRSAIRPAHRPRRARSSSARRPRRATSIAKLIIKLINGIADVVNSDAGSTGAARRVPAELPRVARRAHHPGRRSLRADLDRRQGGLRHRAT